MCDVCSPRVPLADEALRRDQAMSAGYPAETRYLVSACEAFGIGFRDLSGDGYLVEIRHGQRVLALAGGRACIYPSNTATAVGISRDKMHTSNLLEAHGVPTFGGRLFFVTDHHRQYRGPGRESTDALNYARSIGFPIFVKPNAGARGDLAEIVHDEARLSSYLREAALRYDSVVVQEVFEGPEYRVLCVGGAAIAGVQRASGELLGDGVQSVRALVLGYNDSLAGSGVSGIPPATASRIAHESGLQLDDVVPVGRRITLPGRRNLAAGGRAGQLIETVPGELARMAVEAAGLTGLHIAGVDLMDTSTAGDLSQLRVIEVNGAPGLTALEQFGRLDLVLEVWRRILTVVFGADAVSPR